MTKTVAVLAVLLASLLGVFDPARAAAAPSESFAAGTRAFAADDYLLALSHFQAARAEGMTGPAVVYNIGVCQYKLQEYRAAEATFRTIARDYPAMRELAQYNVGLALQRQGREAEARSFFQLAQQNAASDKLASLAGAKAAQAEETSAGTVAKWLALVDLNVGHDDNVALLDESALPAGQSVDSPFTELTTFVTGPLRGPTGFRLDGSAYLVRYEDAGEFDQDVLRLGGTYHWRHDAWRMEAGPQLMHSSLDGESLEQHVRIGASLRRNLPGNFTFGIRVAHDEIDAGAEQYAFVAGSRQQLALTLERSSAGNRLTFGLDFESNDREDPSVSPTRQRVFVRHRQAMSGVWTTDVLLAYRTSDYAQLSAAREEDLVELSAGLIRSLGRQWELNARYAWSDNDSNVEAFSYSRSRFGVGLSKGF